MESKISPNCMKCLKPCSGEVLKYNERIFHPSCLTCGVCNVSLCSRGFFCIDNCYYCTDDYHDLFGTKCHACNQFVEGEVVTALGKTYHQDCFVCNRCKTPFPPGEKVSYTGKDYLCQKCSVAPERRAVPVHKCAGCTQEIKSGQALLALDKHWHLWCFTCTKCRTLLSGEYMGRDGKPYCERDYQAEFGVTCAGCGGYITGKVLQAGEKHYHPKCSRCAKCHREFGEGEEMYLQGSEIWHPDCSRAAGLAVVENGEQDFSMQVNEKPAQLGEKYDASLESPLIATQQREINAAPDEGKFTRTRPTKEFDLTERDSSQVNGDLDDQPPRPPPPERTAASRASEWKRKFSDGTPASSIGARDTSSLNDTTSKQNEYQRNRPYSFHESSYRAPGYGSAPDVNEKKAKSLQRKVSNPSQQPPPPALQVQRHSSDNKKERVFQSKVSVPLQRPSPPALQVRRNSSDNSEAPPLRSNSSGGKYAHHRRSMPTVLPNEVPTDKPPVKAYLTDAEFKKVFSMTRGDFYTLPKWKQNSQKKSLNLF